MSLSIVVSIRVMYFLVRRMVCGWVEGVISYPNVSKVNSAVVLSAIKRISEIHFLLLLQTIQLVFVVPNGQFLPYVLCCLNS